MKNKIIFVIAIILIIISIIIFIPKNNETKQSYSLETLSTIKEEYILIDVRTEEEYIEGYVEGSINIPLDNINEVLDVVDNKNQLILLYCRSGTRSNEAMLELKKMGYENVYDLGGILDKNIELKK